MSEKNREYYGFINVEDKLKNEIYKSDLINLVAEKDFDIVNKVKHRAFSSNAGEYITFYFNAEEKFNKFIEGLKDKFKKNVYFYPGIYRY